MTDKLTAAVTMGLVNEETAGAMRAWADGAGISLLEVVENVINATGSSPKLEALKAFLQATEEHAPAAAAAADAGTGWAGPDATAVVDAGFQILGAIGHGLLTGVQVAAEGVAEVCKGIGDL